MGFFKKKKTASRSPGSIPYSVKNTKYFSWCIDNDIRICVIPNWSTFDSWNVEISIGDKISIDPVDYKSKAALHKMYEYCKYYYDKHNKNEDKV